MTGATSDFEIRRIVVAIDSSSQVSAMLEAAAGLAARLHAELEGLFVEDADLARAAELPVVREISFASGASRDFTTRELTGQYREQAIIARRAIADAATRARVTYGFRVARGQVDVEIISAAGGADLLVIGTGAPTLGQVRRLGRTARAAAERAPRSVLIAPPGTRGLTTPLVLYDGTPAASRALAAAVSIAGTREGALTVLIVAEDLDRAAALREEATARLAPLDVHPNFLHSGRPTSAQLCRLAAEAGADVVVIGADASSAADAERLRLLETIACPVLLVR